MMYGYDFNGAGRWWMVAAMVIVAVVVLGSVWLVTHRPGAPMSAHRSAERGGRPIPVVRRGPEDWAAQAPGKRPDPAP